MALPRSGIVTVRLAAGDADDIDALVAEGRFLSRSDFIRYAIRSTVEALGPPPAAPEDLLSGPGALTEPAGPGRAGRRAAPARRGSQLK